MAWWWQAARWWMNPCLRASLWLWPKPQDKVTGGTLNNSGALTVRITHVGKETRLAQIIALVEQAQAAKLSIQTVLDQVTGVFVPMVMLAAF